ncbi:thioredoxin family protein [Bacillus sp. REN10]|uniref:thioredoxin family protein n=1 Tax=Bacillus sp. REN10 TaxID=2782541 RepID=UPI00193B1270|nr:thioredoxin family protein [Bacillus sp. REN10]
MKKVIIFSSIILILFGGIVFLTKYQQNEASKDNPYGKDDLHPETIKQLDDPNYQNLIMPDELEKKLADGEDVTVYFFSPTCSHCVATTPILMPLAKEQKVDVKQYNVLEFEQGWDEFAIEATPTLIHFENGKEKARLEGSHSKAEYKQFFKENIK